MLVTGEKSYAHDYIIEHANVKQWKRCLLYHGMSITNQKTLPCMKTYYLGLWKREVSYSHTNLQDASITALWNSHYWSLRMDEQLHLQQSDEAVYVGVTTY